MMVNKKIQKGARVSVGDTVRVVMELDTEPRALAVPSDLRKPLEKSARMERFGLVFNSSSVGIFVTPLCDNTSALYPLSRPIQYSASVRDAHSDTVTRTSS